MLEERDDLIKRLAETLVRSDTRNGWCMCGARMEDHYGFSSHSPVDSLQYYAKGMLEEVDALLGTSLVGEIA